MVTYSISKTNADIGEEITLSRSENLDVVSITYWIIDLQPSDYSLPLAKISSRKKMFTIQNPLSTTITITDNHTIAHTLTPITISTFRTQYISTIYTTPIEELQNNPNFTMDIGGPIEVNFNRNIYNQLKFLVKIWTSKKEDKTNKVTSISSSSTNAQYPSAKAVYNLISLIYPIGSIYMSVNNTDPSTFLGGEWEQIEDRFLLASGQTYTAGSTGGEATHTLTTNEMPSHRHTAGTYDGYSIENQGFGNGSTQGIKINLSSSTSTTRIRTNYEGGGQAHNNMPPYLAVYVWKRIG